MNYRIVESVLLTWQTEETILKHISEDGFIMGDVYYTCVFYVWVTNTTQSWMER